MNIYEIGAIISIILVVAGAIMAFYVFPAVWTCKDAKERGMSPLLWTMIVILLQTFGGFICFGFILYLIMRHLNARSKCPECSNRVENKAVYCGTCGKEIDYDKVQPFSKKHNKWLWGILVGVIMMLLGGGLFCISTYYSVPRSFENISLGKIENSWNDVWTVNAAKSTETLSKFIRFDDKEDHGTLVIEASCSEGSVTLIIIGDHTDTYVLSDMDEELTIDLNDFTGDKVELMIVNDAVADLELRADWSDKDAN